MHFIEILSFDTSIILSTKFAHLHVNQTSTLHNLLDINQVQPNDVVGNYEIYPIIFLNNILFYIEF